MPHLYRVSIKSRNAHEVTRDPILVIIAPEHRIQLPRLPFDILVPVFLAPGRYTIQGII